MKSLRTYLAGLGSGGALLGAAVAAFVMLGAVVAFDGLPLGSGESDDSTVLVDSNAPEIAAATAADPAAAPAATPAAVPAGAGAGAADPASGSGGPGSSNSSSGAVERPALPPGPGGTEPVPGPTPGLGPAGGDVAGVVGEVDEAVKGTTGIDLELGKRTEGITGILDEAINDITGGGGLGLGRAELPNGPKITELGGPGS